jgi:hypothetical protein
MALRSRTKRLIAGLTVVSLMFQAASVAAQLSILIAAKANATTALAAGIICTDHGLPSVPSDDSPADRPSACAFCPLCLTPGTDQLAVLPVTSFSLVGVRGEDIVFHFNAACATDEHLAQPRSRGPPATV